MFMFTLMPLAFVIAFAIYDDGVLVLTDDNFEAETAPLN